MSNLRSRVGGPAWWAWPVAAAVAIGAMAAQGCDASDDFDGARQGGGASTDSADGGGTTGTASDPACTTTPSPPQPAPIQRLTKLEYNNVIRDLFGLTKDYSATFSADAEGLGGFTNEGLAQNLSVGVVNDYWNAAKAVVDDAFAAKPNPLLTCSSGDDCAKTILTALARRAFRQAPSDDEIAGLMEVYKGSTSSVFTDALKLAVRTILLSPRFIFRVYELPSAAAPTAPLTDHELASRLSFFIWGSIPDEALLTDADQGRLQQEDVLKAHVRRMIADPRVAYLAQSFGYQWLKLDRFETTQLDTTRFPTWNESLKSSMRAETLAFTNNVFTQDQSVMDFVGAKYSFLDKNLSQHYGIPGATGSDLVKLPLDDHRVGVLTQASILTLTSVSNRTAPVRRGKWILDQILCSSVGAPPANVPPLPAPPNGGAYDESQIRQRLSQHTQQGPACIACHNVLDPIGFAYENYDAAGIYRTTYLNGTPVDASGQLPTGEKLSNFMDLAKVLQTDPRFPQCFTKRMASFASGRDMTGSTDRCTTQAIAQASVSQNHKFSDLVLELVLDASFRSRQVSN